MAQRATKKERRILRHRSIRAKLSGTGEIPRLAVFRSNDAVYVQLIDDIRGFTLAAASSSGLNIPKTKKAGAIALSPGRAKAYEVGRTIAVAAKKIGVECVKFDRGGFAYHGAVKALAEGAREAGLKC